MAHRPIAGPADLLPGLLLTLSVGTGLVDAISVLGLGKVFTANMTGNVVFLGFAAAGAPGFRPGPYVAALAAFVAGAVLAGRTGRAHAGRTLRRWLITAAVVEAALLWAAAGVALSFDKATQTPGTALYGLIALTAAAMGFRNATIRQLKIPDLTTTVLTLTVTGVAADSPLAGGDNAGWARRIGAILAILAGACAGALLVMRTGLSLPLAIAGLLTLASTLACAVHPAAGRPHSG